MSKSSAGIKKLGEVNFRFGWLFVCLLVLAACGSGCDIVTYPLGGAQFAQRGRELADDSFPSISVMDSRVDAIFPELMLYKTMEARLGGGGVGVDPNKPVWLVTVKGHFTLNILGGRVEATERIFVFDADSGELMQLQFGDGK